MAVILAFVPFSSRPRIAAADQSAPIGAPRLTGMAHWVLDPETGTLICRWDVEPAAPSSSHSLKSA